MGLERSPARPRRLEVKISQGGQRQDHGYASVMKEWAELWPWWPPAHIATSRITDPWAEGPRVVNIVSETQGLLVEIVFKVEVLHTGLCRVMPSHSAEADRFLQASAKTKVQRTGQGWVGRAGAGQT